jgi:hypothetical protein
MARPTEIDVATLRAQVNALLDLFEKKGVRSVSLDADLYWSINWGEEYDFSSDPKPVVGSLADDIEFLAGAENQPVALMLCHASPLLHFLGRRADDYGVYL